MHRIASWTLALAFVATSTSCGDGSGGPIQGDPVPPGEAPEAVSSTFCSAWVECNCDAYNQRFASEAECDAAIEADVDADVAAGEAAGLTYDAQCLGDLLAAYEQVGCKSIADVLDDLDAFVELYGVCKVFHGDDAAGEPCTAPDDVLGDSCEQGTRCEDGVCRSTALIAEGASCDPGDLCAAGSYCVPVETPDAYVCTALPALGGTCLGVLDLCGLDTYCDQPSKKCVGLPAVGQSCAPQGTLLGSRCADDGICEDDTCVAAPAAGEPCTEGCARGSTCEDDVCVVSPPLVCGADLG